MQLLTRWLRTLLPALSLTVHTGETARTSPAGGAVAPGEEARSVGPAHPHPSTPTPRVHLVSQEPTRITRLASDVVLIDYARVAFGNLRLTPPPGCDRTITVHFGEALADGRVLRTPPGSVRHAKVSVRLAGEGTVRVAPPADRRNTGVDNPRQPPAVLTPPEWGVVVPFRWVEIEGWPGEPRSEQVIRQAAFSHTWDDQAATFHSSDDLLDRLWELCRYSIKATTFAGIYVDGDREQIAYEADAHLNQLSHYATDHDVQMSRDTFDWLMRHPTWPTEWASYMIFIAHADWWHTGDTGWLAPRYPGLKDKLLTHRLRIDGLVHSTDDRLRRLDLVDWPAGERDGYVFTSVNTVVNAFHLRALRLMAELAAALGHPGEAADFAHRARVAHAAFNTLLWDPERGRYRDGPDTGHTSLHANLFPLAFGLVPETGRPGVTDWLVGRGMACSVYAAQYLLEGLFQQEAGTQALALMTADGDRSWKHMLASGTTITWEAWDQKYKPNQDWNHPWGAAPANLLPRFVLGVQASEPGWRSARIQPHPGHLTFARGKVPTPRGPIEVLWHREPRFRLTLRLPESMSARVELPALSASAGVFSTGGGGAEPVPARRQGARWILDRPVTGHVELEVR